MYFIKLSRYLNFLANDHKLKVIANTTSFTPQVLCGKDESTWVDRLGREIRSLQFLTVQQYLEHPIDGIMTQTASALSGITRSQAMARIGGRRGRLERLLGGHSRENFDGIEDHDDDDVEDETDNGTEEDDDEDENEEDDDDDNHDDDDEEIGSSVHTDEDEENDEEVSAPVPSERRNGLSIQTSSLRPKLSGIIQVGNGAALPEELILVHNWCDSPLLFHGMFDTPTDPARLFEPSTPSALAFAAGFSMTSLSPLPNPGQIFFPPNSVPSHPQMSSVDSMLAQWAFLRQLTDAPNGSGLSQRLVGIMKKYVREDQGSEAGPNHAVHATCAALIWHEGLAEEALDIVKSSQNGVDRRPSKALQTVWKKSQAMRNIFPEDDTTDSMLTRSDSFKSVGGDDSIQSKPRLEMQRQFSLPVQSPLLPTATLGAVRRARLLLSYYPATVVTKLPSETQTQAQTQDLSRTTSLDSITGASSVLRGYFDLIREQCIDLKPAASDQLFGHSTTLKRFKNLTISECVTAFIHSGPDPDLVRKVADERSQLADNRAKGISVALELLRGTSDESKKADVLYKVAESIAFCSKALPAKTEFEKAINKKDSDKENDLATSDKKDKSSIDATVFRFVGCHYSNMLSGCTRHAKAYLDSLWLDFVKEVVSLGMTWLDQLEKSLSKSSTDASLEYALLGTLSIVGMDYCEGDIDYIVSSGIYLFLSTAAYSWNESVRRLSISSLERLLHLTCRLQQSAPRSGHEAPAYHTDAQNLPSAKSLFKLLLAFFRDRVKSSCEFSKMAPNILSVSRDLNDLPVTFVNQPFQPKWLLQGSVICDPNEEGLAIKASSMTPNFVMDPVDSSFHLFPDHSMSFWLYVERKCIDGTILTRLMGDIDAWSFVSIRLVDGKLVFLAGNKQSIGNFAHTEVNQLNSSKTTSDPDENIICGINMTAFDGVHVESSVLPCDQWVHVGYTIESKTSVVCLYVNGAVVSTKPLRAAMAAAPFPFQELLPQAMRVSQASQPFIIGQVPTALSSIGRSASCVVANIVVTCGPIDISEMVVLGSHTAPEVTRGLTTGSIKANTNSTESGIQYTSVADKSTAYSVIPRTGSDATISIKLESGQDSSKLSGVTFGLIAINNTDQYASFDNLHMFDANIKSFGFQCDVSDSSVAIGRTSPTSVPGIKSGDVVNLTYSFTAKKLILIINRSESDSISHEVSLKELDSNQVESMSLAFAVTLRNWQSATVIQPQDSRPQIIEKLTTMEEETKKVPVEDVPPVVEHINQIITSFDPDLSNTSRLEFASLNSTVYYPTATTERNQSLPPVTAVRLCQPRVSFTVMLSRNVMINDLLSVGLARIFTQASAEEIIQAKFEKTMEYFLQKKSGFGIEKGSYGIYDVRKEESEEPAKIAGGPSSTIKTFRKLVEGDMISWTVDFLAPVPWAEIVINGGEFTHRFTQLPGVYSQYVFGIVMAVEHEFVLIPDSSILDGLPLPSKADPVKIDASLSVSKPYPYKIILPSFDSTTLLWNWDSSFLLRCNQNAVKENVLFGSEASGLSISDRCSKKDVVRLCSSVSRVAKSLLALTIITNEYKLDDISSTDMPFDGIFTEWLVDDQVLHALADMTCLANSSTVRQAATKVICQLIPLLPPDTVDKVFNKGCFVPDSQNISFFHKVVRVLGQLANPYSVGIPDYSSQSSSFSQDFVTTSFRQTLDLVKSITHSPLQVWWREVHRLFEHSLAAFSEIIKDLSGSIESAQSLLNANSVGLIEKTNVLMDALSSTKTKSLSSVDVCDIVGFLTISCGGWIPSLGLLPGAVVSHSGPGNSLPERYVVAGFSPLSLFGETLVVYPLDIVDSNDPSEIEATSLSLTTFEVVFSAFLQSEQPATTLAPAIAYSLCHENLRLDVFSFLSHLILTDTSDQRPPLQAEFEVAQAPITPLERRMVMESPHPYRDNTDEVFEISIPGAVELVISFDPQSKTEANYDYLRFYKDSSQSSYWGQEKYSGTTWPGINGLEPLKIGAGSCLLQFHTDGSNK